MPTWSYVDWQIDSGDDDEREAFSKMLENESPFSMCEGGDGCWRATIRSGRGCDFLESASGKFPGLLFVVQEYSDDMGYHRSFKWKAGEIVYGHVHERNFSFELDAEQVQECVDWMEECVRDDPFDEMYKKGGLTKLYGLENEQPTTADIRSILAGEFFRYEMVCCWCSDEKGFEEHHRDMIMDNLEKQLLELFLQKAKEIAKEKLASIFSSVVVLKRFVRSYVEYSNAPGGYAYKKALERFENLAEETKVAGKVHGEVNEKTAAADKSSKLKSEGGRGEIKKREILSPQSLAFSLVSTPNNQHLFKAKERSDSPASVRSCGTEPYDDNSPRSTEGGERGLTSMDVQMLRVKLLTAENLPVVVDGSVSWQAEEPSSSLSSPKKSSSTEAARAAKKKKSLQHVNVNVLPSLAAAKNKAPPPAAPSARKAVLPSAPSVPKMVVSPSAKKPVTPHAVTAATPPLSSAAAVSTSTPFPLRDVLRRNVQLQSLSSAAGSPDCISQFPVSPSTTGVVPTPPTIRQAVKVHVHVEE